MRWPWGWFCRDNVIAAGLDKLRAERSPVANRHCGWRVLDASVKESGTSAETILSRSHLILLCGFLDLFWIMYSYMGFVVALPGGF